MKEPKILIYRFLERSDGTSPEPIDSYDPSQLGGHVPAVGDLIIDPGVPEGWDQRNPEARRISQGPAKPAYKSLVGSRRVPRRRG